MGWQILFVINLVSASVREYLNKQIADRLNPVVAFFHLALYFGVWLLISFLVFYHRWPRLDITIISTGVLFLVAFIAYLKAVKYSLSQSILFQSYSILVTVLLAVVFLGEAGYLDITTSLGQKVIGGGVLAIMSLWLMLRGNGKKDEKL